jgi:hypothetical protein
MKCNCRSKALVAVLLSLVLLATGCTAQWISVALADLPVLTQMALNIGTLVTTLESGHQLSASDAAAVQNISQQASNDLNLLQVLYNEYKANPGTGTIQKIQSAIADLNQNLTAVLQAAHISDPTLSARVTAGVNLILTTVASFAQLLPQTPGAAQAQKVGGPGAGQKASIPKASDLKKQWNQQICGPTANGALNAASGACVVR